MTEKEKFGKARLLEAMRQFDRTYPDSFPISEEKIRYSGAYQKEIRRLAYSLDGKASPRLLGWKRVMMVAITSIVVLFSALSISAVAAGKSLPTYIATLYENFIEIIFEKEQIVSAPETIDTVYSLSYFPKHYYVEEADISVFTSQIVWKKREGDKLILHQSILSSHELLIHGEAEFETFVCQDKEIIYFERGGQIFFFWTQYGYAFELSGPSEISREEYVRMIVSIRESGYTRYRTNSWLDMYHNAYFGKGEN